MRIMSYQRMSTEDGPGLRTTLFFKGCPLKCAWCHNPESINPKKEIEWLGVRCMGCKSCISTCPVQALKFDPKGLNINRNRCVSCLKCVEGCPTTALEVLGKETSVEEAFNELIKDKAYFGDNGGVTLSGGEVTLQWKEAMVLLKKLKENGCHTAVDTCGFCQGEALEALVPYTDLFLYDLKIFDDKLHQKFCGVSVLPILENFDFLTNKVGAEKIWVRTPIIPNATDSEENIVKLGNFINNRVIKWELCAFNNLCKDKYARLGKSWLFNDALLKTKEQMETLVKVCAMSGTDAVWSGMTLDK